MPVNPLRKDPTRTKMLRDRFANDLKRRFVRISKSINELVVVHDVFGLVDRHTLNTLWKFDTNDRKLTKFNRWLQQQIADNVLEITSGGEDDPWTVRYVNEAYFKGHGRSFDETKKGKKFGREFFAGGKTQFMAEAHIGQVSTDTIRLLNTRTFDDLKGITSTMSTQIGRQLTEGLLRGLSPREIAVNLNDRVKKIGIARATTLARTEIIHAFAEGALDGYERLGVEDLGVVVEWDTAEDGRVCPLCAPLDGIVMKVSEMRGLFPRHPNCRCFPIPAFKDDKEPGQIRTRKRIAAAIRRSVRKEKSSSWAGAK